MKMDLDSTSDLAYRMTDGSVMLTRLVEAFKRGGEVDPEIVTWFCKAHEKGRIKVSRLKPGRPSIVPADKLKEVMGILLELRAKGETAASAAVSVGTRLGISIDKAYAQKLLEEARMLRREENEERLIATRALAIREFRTRRQRGVLGTQALREVRDLPEWPIQPDVELLQLWQIQEEETARLIAGEEFKD
ncbi:MAG: hypothetical protein ABI885_30670 [Gammaproteobacteria bacterium]